MVLVSTLIGRVLGGGALIWANYKALGDQANATKTLFYCLGGVLLLFVAGLFLPHGSSAGLAGGLAAGLRVLTQQSQWKTQSPKASWWFAILIGFAGLIVTLLLVLVFSVMTSMLFPQLVK